MIRRGSLIGLFSIIALAPALALAGTQTYSTPGTYTFTVPAYGTLTVQVWGGGGSGGSYNYTSGNSGKSSSFAGISAGGGGSGGGYPWGGPGAGGRASGGDTNENGNSGQSGSQGTGGSAPNGGAGGAGGISGSPGSVPGGGGGGVGGGMAGYAGGGGSGGYATKTYTNGLLSPGSTVTVIVGNGGSSVTNAGEPSGPGASGEVAINWTSASPVFCPNGTSAPGNDASQCTCAQGNQNACTPDPCTTNPLLCAPGLGGGTPPQCNEGYVDLNNTCTLSCPAGQAYQGNQCVSSCDPGYTAEGGVCTLTTCPSGSTEVDTPDGSFCSVTSCPENSTRVPTNEPGVYSCSYTGGNNGTGGTTTPPPTITAWKVAPLLVKSGGTTEVSWSAENVSRCIVTGTNDDGPWSGPSGNETSSSITAQTIYTLECIGDDGSQISTSSVVSIAPVFEER